MKRLFLFLMVCLVAGGFVIASMAGLPEASAKASATSKIKLDSLAGKTIKSAVRTYGKQSRIDASEYGFIWYVFKKNYKRFMMLGVYKGKVVAGYCNSKYVRYQNIRVGTTRTYVRKKYGAPITSARIGNCLYVFPNTDRKDTYLIKGYYVYFYYDVFNKYKVTSIMFVKKSFEDKLLGKPLKLSSKAVSAYSKQSVDLVNAIRARHGLKKLSTYNKASKFALTRSKDMRKRNYFSHYTPEGKSPAYLAKRYGLKYRKLCENIAYGHRNAVNAFEAFMNSKGHRRNILNKTVRQMGAGTAYGGSRSVIVTYTLLKKK